MDTLWNAKPFLRILLCIVFGILLAEYIAIPILLVYGVVVFSIGFILIWMRSVGPVTRYAYDWLEGLAFFLLMVSIGYSRAYVYDALNYTDHFSDRDSYDSFVFELTQPAEPKERSTQLVGKVIALSDSLGMKSTSGKAVLYLKNDPAMKLPFYGDQLLVKSRLNKLKPPTNPGQFDYSAYQSNENIFHSSYVKENQWTVLSEGSSTSFWSAIYTARSYLLNTIDRYVEAEDEKAVASALLVGYRQLLPKDIKDVYAHTGSMHVLAVSGLHVGILVMLLNHLLGFLKRRQNPKLLKLHFVVIVSAVWLFALLTGFKPSVARAAVMFTFLQIGLSQKQTIDIIHVTIISAVTLLLINPNNLFKAGFQLSYGALLGILFFQRRIYELFFIYNRPIDKAWKLTSVGIAAQIGTLPLSLYYFGFFPLVFFLSNLLIILGATAVLGIGLLLFVVSPIEKLAQMVGGMLEWVVWFINRYLQLLSNIPNVVIEDIQISGLQVFLLYLFISIITFALVTERKGVLKYALSVFLGFSVLTSFEKIGSTYDSSIVVYDTGKNFCLGLHSGKQSLLIHDFSEVDDNDVFAYNVRPHLTELGTQAAEYINLNELDSLNQLFFEAINVQNGFIQFGGHKIFVPTNKLRVDTNAHRIETDFLVIPKKQSWSKNYLKEFVDSENEIYVSEFRPRPGNNYFGLNDDKTQHFIRSDGAFSLALK